MGKAARDKGNRRERELTALLPGAQKISAMYKPGPDLIWNGRLIEVKARQTGMKKAYDWLEDANMLAYKADRKPWLIILPLNELLDILEENQT